MIKINELYIRVHTDNELLEFNQTFSSKLNVITSYTNTKGKSTIGESILFCLGLEEILGHKNEQAVKPVLRSKIEVDGKEEDVVQSDVFLEVENTDGSIITIQRSPKHNTRDARLVSVYDRNLKDVIESKCKYTDYFVHDPGAAVNVRGFHNYLQGFVGIELPNVASYDGKAIKLYIQTIASCFYIEQKKGWMNVLATLPTYYRIKDVKKRVLEFVMGLSVLDTEREYNIAKAKLKDTEREWKLLTDNMLSRVSKFHGAQIYGINKKPHIIDVEESYRLLVDGKFDSKLELPEYLEEINLHIESLNNTKEPTVENREGALVRELKELDELFKQFNIQKSDVQQTYMLEKEQLEAITHRLNNVNTDLSENKDLRKLIGLGSLEDTSIQQSNCPTCGRTVDDTLFDQDGELKIMSIDDSIVHLGSEKKMLEFSLEAQQLNINSQKILLEKIDNRISDIASRIRVVKSDLVSNNKAISQSHIQRIVELEVEKKELELLLVDISNLWEQLKNVGIQWGIDKSALDKIPSDFVTDDDRIRLKMLRKEFKRLLGIFKYESTNIENISIDDYNYLPVVEGFDLHSDSSASDTIRIIWAYVTSLQLVANKYGNNLGFLVLDEPAQQNTDVSSAKELLKELIALSNSQQIFVLYKLESDDLFSDIENDNFYRIHADTYLVKKRTKMES